jgi:uridine kinase
MEQLVIDVSGPSGSGKSTLCKRLLSEFKDNSYIELDRFYKNILPKVISPINGREYDDWNQPDSIDEEKVFAALKEAKSSGYKYIIVDGAFLFCFPRLLEETDVKIYTDASIETRFYRRIKRNLGWGNLTLDDIAEYYLNCARFSEKKYSVASKKYADIVINTEYDFENQLSILIKKIRDI